jgi:hypothetical protein
MPGPWSIAPACDTLTQGFGCVDNDKEWLDSACGTNRNHHGIDLAAWNVQGAPVYSARAGVVAAVGIQFLGPNAVCVLNDDGVYVEYGHMDTNTVNVGDRVVAGQQIGTVGNQGASTGPHLHVEARTDGPWQTQSTSPLVDPSPYLTVLVAPKPAPPPVQEETSSMIKSIYYGDGYRHWVLVTPDGKVKHWAVNVHDLTNQAHSVLGTGAAVPGGVELAILGEQGEQIDVTVPGANGNLLHWFLRPGMAPWGYEEITFA